MTAICFVCNLPIMSHQVGLGKITRESPLQIIYIYIFFITFIAFAVWSGGNGWDDLMREQVT